MNEKFEEYIKDLSPELQEKARQCKTKDELMQLVADEDLEIPMDALEGVAGGCDVFGSLYCAECGSERLGTSSNSMGVISYYCLDCGSTDIKRR